MDNAAKALVMAGAILLTIAIIGVGVYIYSAGADAAKQSVSNLDQTNNNVWNQQFYVFAGQGATPSTKNAQHLKDLAASLGIPVNNSKGAVTYTYKNGKISEITFAK